MDKLNQRLLTPSVQTHCKCLAAATRLDSVLANAPMYKSTIPSEEAGLMPTQVGAHNELDDDWAVTPPGQVHGNSAPPHPSGTAGTAWSSSADSGAPDSAAGVATAEVGVDAVVEPGLPDPNRLLPGVPGVLVSDLGISFRQKGERLSSKSSLQAIHRRPLQCAWLLDALQGFGLNSEGCGF